MKVAATLLLLASVVPQGALAQGATLEATPAGRAPAGSTVTVKWSGPNGPGDYITVVRKGAGPSEYLSYRQTSDGRVPVNPDGRVQIELGVIVYIAQLNDPVGKSATYSCELLGLRPGTTL